MNVHKNALPTPKRSSASGQRSPAGGAHNSGGGRRVKRAHYTQSGTATLRQGDSTGCSTAARGSRTTSRGSDATKVERAHNVAAHAEADLRARIAERGISRSTVTRLPGFWG